MIQWYQKACADAVSLSEGIIQLSFLKNTHLFVI